MNQEIKVNLKKCSVGHEDRPIIHVMVGEPDEVIIHIEGDLEVYQRFSDPGGQEICLSNHDAALLASLLLKMININLSVND